MLSALQRTWRRFQFWWKREQLEEELREELELHALLKETERSDGLLVAAEVRKAMGNITLAREQSRDFWGFLSVEQLMQDVRYALRIFRTNPGFSLVAVISLAIGIAGNTAIFSIVNALLIRPLPFPECDRLIRITSVYSKAVLQLFQRECRSMDVASVSPGSEFNLTGQGPAARITGSETSVNFFSVLGAAAARGRTFEPGEDRPGSDGVVVLSDAIWRTRFHNDSDVIGRSVVLAGVNRRIIGVMPRSFAFPSTKVQLWIPVRMDPSKQDDYWGGAFVPFIGRLRTGVTFAQARGEIHSLTANLWKLFPWPMPKHWNADSTVISLQTDLVGDTRSRLFVLVAAVGAVLLIACANVASLLLARATTRRKEMAMRAALGAGAFRIIRQLLTESIVIALIAGAIGLFVGAIAISLFRFVVPADLPGAANISVDWHVAGFAAILSLLTGLSFGIVPALSARNFNLIEAMKTGSQRFTTHGSLTLRSWLIAGEMALTLVLIAGAGLLLRSLYELSRVNLGFDTQRIVAIEISPNESFCAHREACIAFYSRLMSEARGASGVLGVALTNTVPLDGELPAIAADVQDHPKSADFPSPMLWLGAVSPNYLQLMHIPLLRGRSFTDADGPTAPPVILISASTAKRFWPGVNPVGKHIKSSSETGWRTIVGVVADVRQFDLANNSPGGISGAMYMPYAQAIQDSGQIPAVMNLLAKTTATPEQVGIELRRIAAEANPNIPVGKVVTLKEIVGDSLSGFRSTIWVFLSFAGTAVLLAAVGIYGLLSYTVSQRAYEISVRMAIGATSVSIIGMVLSQSVRITLAGMSAGIAASVLLTRFLSGLLFGVSATDPLTFGAVSILLLMVALVASMIPAWRAACIDPIRTLRAE